MKIPSFENKEDLFAYLVKNEKELIESKCAFPKKSDNQSFPYIVRKGGKSKSFGKKGFFANKAEVSTIKEGVINVSVVGNSANFIDSQLDCLQPNCWKKSITELGVKGKNRIKHLKNHQQDTDGIVGYPTDIYSIMVNIQDLGYNAFGQTQVLVMDSDVHKELDAKTYKLYIDKQINQHSVGLQYVKMCLCVNSNSADYTQQFENWNKYYPTVINKEIADQFGYFCAVTEIKLLEVSAVVWGANELTPTLEPIEEKNDIQEVELKSETEITQEQPTIVTEQTKDELTRKSLLEFYQNLN